MSTMYVNNIAPLEGTTINVASGSTLVQPGTILQVVQGTHTSQVESSFSSATTIVSASITPLYSNSKILIMVNIGTCGSRDTSTFFKAYVTKGGSNLFAFGQYIGYPDGSAENQGTFSGTYLDTAGSTTSITYAAVGRRIQGSANCVANFDDGEAPDPTATIILQEIAQ